MDINDKINIIERNTNEFCNQIEMIPDLKEQGLIKFILTCCLIDAVATYSGEKGRNNTMYKGFVEKYLGKVNTEYQNKNIKEKIYSCIRCSLIHSFTIESGVLLCQVNNTKIHLTHNIDKYLIVELNTFFEDVKKAIKLFFKDLRKGEGDIQKIFKKAFSKNIPFSIYTNVTSLDPNETATGKTENPALIKYNVVNFRRM
jgi:hypothetical protein